MNTRQTIDLFLQEKKLAIAGVLLNPKKFGHVVYKNAIENGLSAKPVNPKGGLIDGVTCVESVTKLNSDVQNLLIVTHKDRHGNNY